DYTVTITGINPNCLSPSNLSLKKVENNRATLVWDTVGNADDGYTWRLMAEGDDPDMDTPIDSATVTKTTDSATVGSLVKGMPYDFYIRSNCSASEQSIWEKKTFYNADPG